MYIRSSTTEFSFPVKIYLTSLLSISIACIIFSMLLYLLNISKFKNVNERMKFPLKINRAVFVVNMFLAVLIWQVLILIEIHNYGYFTSNEVERTIVLFCMYISGIIFYLWYFIWMMLLFLTVHYVHVSMFKDKMKLLYSYIFVTFTLAVFLVLNILVANFQGNGSSFVEKYTNSKVPYWIINSMQILAVIYGAVVIFHLIYIRAKQFHQADKSTKEIVYLLLTSVYVRNKIIFFLILLMIMVADLMHIADALSFDAYCYIYGIFHSLLVSNGFLRPRYHIYSNKICIIFEIPSFCTFESFLMSI